MFAHGISGQNRRTFDPIAEKNTLRDLQNAEFGLKSRLFERDLQSVQSDERGERAVLNVV